jgi:hypothetical protein
MRFWAENDEKFLSWWICEGTGRLIDRRERDEVGHLCRVDGGGQVSYGWDHWFLVSMWFYQCEGGLGCAVP